MTDVPSGLAATQLLLSQKTSRASQKVWASTNDPSCEIRRQQIHVQKAYKNIISHDISLSCFLVVLFDSSTSGLKKTPWLPPTTSKVTPAVQPQVQKLHDAARYHAMRMIALNLGIGLKNINIFAIYGISDDSWTCVPHVPNISFEVDPYHEGSRGLSPSKRRFGKSKWWSKHLILPMLLMPQPSGCLRKLRKYTRRCVQPALSTRTSKVNQSSREWGRHRHQAPANRVFALDLNQGVDTATDKRATKLLLIEDFFPELGKSNYFELIPLDSFSMLDHQMDIKLIYQVASSQVSSFTLRAPPQIALFQPAALFGMWKTRDLLLVPNMYQTKWKNNDKLTKPEKGWNESQRLLFDSRHRVKLHLIHMAWLKHEAPQHQQLLSGHNFPIIKWTFLG